MQNIHKTVSTTSRKFCSVPQCTSYTTKEVSLHKFPKDKHLLKKWQHILKINKTVSKYMFVCSKHFDEQDFFFGDIPQVYNATKRRRLKNNVIPTRNLPLTALDKKLNNLKPKSRRSRWLDKKILEQHVSKDLNEEVQNQIDIPNTFPLEENIHQQEVENISEPSTSEETNFSRNISTQTINFEYNFTELLSDDSKLNSFTGINTNILSTFVKMYEKHMTDLGLQYPTNEIRKNILLVMCKLKLNLSFTCLAVLFKISKKKCSNIFKVVVSNLAVVVNVAIYWPPKNHILKNLPTCFNNFKDTRVVFDCTEIKVQKFNCLKSRLLTNSQYKGTHTIKILIGIAPSGLITYVSPAYGGRATDKTIFLKENVIEKLDPYDAVMVDKGFLIKKECEERYIKVYQPPFLRQQTQLSKDDAILTAEIARARVHVERAIQRIKIFKILQEQIHLQLLPYIDDIITIIAAVVNCSSPIISENKF